MLRRRGRKPANGAPDAAAKVPPKQAPRAIPQASPTWTANVAALHACLNRKDSFGAADAASHLTDDACTRADRVAQTWLPVRIRGLFPRKVRSGTPDDQLWSYRDCAADFYCHLVIEGLLLAPAHLPELRDTLARERAITAGVPTAMRLDTGKLADDDQGIFGAAEYLKDGLLSILERMGQTEWLDRLHEVLSAVLHSLPVETRYGRLPSQDCETNGDLLQTLSRLYHRERRPEYLTAGRAMADAYTREVLPNNGWILADDWDFAAGRSAGYQNLWLLDHGNESVSGLVEWTIAESVAPDSRREAYAPAIEHMLDTLLDRGRDTSGMWLRETLPAGAPVPAPSPQPLNDTWGYLSAAYVAYALTLPAGNPRRERYMGEARRALQAASSLHRAAWQDGFFDGYADSIEGALYLLPYFDETEIARWIDEETGVFLAYQREDGFVGRNYLDGNYIRTSLLYAMFRTGGTRVEPWEPGVRLGAVRSPQGLQLALSCDRPHSVRLVFDNVRHRDYLHLPFDYPRLNSWTEWFPIDRKTHYEVSSKRPDGAPSVHTYSGKKLLEGLPVDLRAEPLYLHVKHAVTA